MSIKTDATDILRIHTPGLGGLLVTLLFIGLPCLILLALGLLQLANGNSIMGLFLLVMAIFMGLLTRYCWKDLRSRQAWMVTLVPEALKLYLPAGRSIAHQLSTIHKDIRLDEIARIEKRLEAYRSIGMVNMLRSYALKLKTGEVIILGEDRALGTALRNEKLAKKMLPITSHAGLGIHDLGMVEGNGGILGIFNVEPPPWDAPSLGAKKQADLWRRAELTGSLTFTAVVVVLGTMVLFSFI